MKKKIVKFFVKFFEVFQSCHKFFEVFASFSRLSDPFGPIRIHPDAFGSNWKRLDVSKKILNFESFFNVSGRNFYKKLFSRHNILFSSFPHIFGAPIDRP